MIEFGEKLKLAREGKGMTQQTLAEHLYVTRQAVSRWECGARYPDLLTAKRIAEILDTSIDELVSGEDVTERESLLAGAKYRVLQIVLYVIGVIPFLLMTIFSVKSFFPEESLQGTPAGEITILTVATFLQYTVVMITMVFGLFLALKNRLIPTRTGIIMSIPFWAEMVTYAIPYWKEGILPAITATCILCFFHEKGCRNRFLQVILPLVIGCIGIHRLYTILQVCKKLTIYYTDLGFVVTIVHILGEVILVILLFIQTMALIRKRASAL